MTYVNYQHAIRGRSRLKTCLIIEVVSFTLLFLSNFPFFRRIVSNIFSIVKLRDFCSLSILCQLWRSLKNSRYIESKPESIFFIDSKMYMFINGTIFCLDESSN